MIDDESFSGEREPRESFKQGPMAKLRRTRHKKSESDFSEDFFEFTVIYEYDKCISTFLRHSYHLETSQILSNHSE